MRFFPKRRKTLGEASTAKGAKERHWRRVPKVDLISTKESKHPGVILFRVFLGLVIIGVAYLVQAQYFEWQDTLDRTTVGSRDLDSVQSSISNKQGELDIIRGQVDQLKQQKGALDNVYQSVTSSRVNWGEALPAVFGTQVQGISFESVVAKPGGRLEISGKATDQRAIARFQTELRGVSRTLDLQSVAFKTGEESFEFVAEVKVRRE